MHLRAPADKRPLDISLTVSQDVREVKGKVLQYVQFLFLSIPHNLIQMGNRSRSAQLR